MLLYTLRVAAQIGLGYLYPPSINLVKKCVPVAFRCWPIDLDTYLHMNNANYLRVAELARWRIFPVSGLMKLSLERGWMFLAVEQTITYLKPIRPFQRYIVSTKLSHKENKWLFYEHTFEQHPADVARGSEAVKFCIINLRAVLKEKGGKTVRPLELIAASDWNRQIVTAAD